MLPELGSEPKAVKVPPLSVNTKSRGASTSGVQLKGFKAGCAFGGFIVIVM